MKTASSPHGSCCKCMLRTHSSNELDQQCIGWPSFENDGCHCLAIHLDQLVSYGQLLMVAAGWVGHRRSNRGVFPRRCQVLPFLEKSKTLMNRPRSHTKSVSSGGKGRRCSSNIPQKSYTATSRGFPKTTLRHLSSEELFEDDHNL